MKSSFSWPSRHFWLQWLLHWLVLWTTIAFGDSGIGWYYGRYHPWQHAWQLFSNYSEAVVWIIMILAVEALYHGVFRRHSFWIFLAGVPAAFVALEWVAVVCRKLYFGGIPPFLFLPVILVSFYAIGYALLRHFLGQRYREAASRAAQSETELAALRADLNPHFFFNTINTLYGVALEENASRTAECVERLARLMRYTLRDIPNDAVPVAEEIQFVRDYLAIQQLRLPTRPTLDVRTEIDYNGKAAAIAPLLLLLFLKNAFAYGISIDQACFLHLTLHIEHGQLTMQLANRVLPLRNRQQGAGTGLRNVRQRLARLYPGRHTLQIAETADTFTVQLRLRLNNTPLVGIAASEARVTTA